MKLILVTLLLCIVGSGAIADANDNIEGLVEDFSNAMGVNLLVEQMLEQARTALVAQMRELSIGFKVQFPDATDQQLAEIDAVFDEYITSILAAVDPQQAANIYATEIAQGLPAPEIEAATTYYQSPEGQRLLAVVSVASSKLNQYLLDQIGEATIEAQATLTTDLQAVVARIGGESR